MFSIHDGLLAACTKSVQAVKPEYLVVAVALARIPGGLFLVQARLFGRLDIGHVATENPQYAAAVHSALEATKGTVNRLVVANFDSYGHSFF